MHGQRLNFLPLTLKKLDVKQEPIVIKNGQIPERFFWLFDNTDVKWILIQIQEICCSIRENPSPLLYWPITEFILFF